MSKIYLNYSSFREVNRNIYFIIDLRELKITKIFKDENYLKTLESNYYLMCYKCPIYRGNLVYIGDNKSISFKALANQIMQNSLSIAKECETRIEWKPNFEIDRK